MRSNLRLEVCFVEVNNPYSVLYYSTIGSFIIGNVTSVGTAEGLPKVDIELKAGLNILYVPCLLVLLKRPNA